MRVPSLGITWGVILRRVRSALAYRTEPSWDHALCENLEEDAARVHRHAVVVSPIHSAKLPAMQSAVERFAEAVPRANPRICLNGVAPVLLEQPDRLQVSLPTVGRLHVAVCEQQARCFEGTESL